MKHKRYLLPRVFFLLLLAGILINTYLNTRVGTTEYPFSSDRLPASFDGFRIAQVSDLHNDDLGDADRLTAAVRSTQPDIIVITGDLIDANRTDVALALAFTDHFTSIAPTYYINGNHEWVPEYAALVRGMEEQGVVVLEDASVRIEQNGEFFHLAGVVDPLLSERPFIEQLQQTLPMDDVFTILLSHRPERMRQYADTGVDLVLAGHAHGGQIRLPLIGGLYAPSQGFFPNYYQGMYTRGQTTMIVSRGIGNSRFPLRINNPPELVVIELQRP